MSIAPGRRLGPYEISSSLGAGGMGEVYRARDTRIGREVAVKILPASIAEDRDRLQRFEREARAAGSLNHPNLLSLFDVGTHDGAPYIVTELLGGATLRELLTGGSLPSRKAVDYGAQIARGLAAAHEKGIIHRDLKPENLFVTRDGRVKVLDFGLAKLTRPGEAEKARPEVSTATSPTEAGVLLGTVGYMSPEQVSGQAADERSDIFALGAVLYEMLSGKRAFKRDSPVETLNAILKEDPPEIAGPAVPIPPALDRIMRRCLEKNAAERFRSAHDLALALEAISGGGTAVLSRPRPGRAPWLALVGAFTLAGVVAAFYLLGGRPRPASSPVRVVPITALPGQQVAPSFSPDGSQIAFAWSPEGTQNRFDLFVKVIGSEKALQLTTHPAEWISPAWSPDGRVIAFGRLAGEESGLYLVPALGGPERKLAKAAFSYPVATIVNWSPDGKLLAYADEAKPLHITLLEVATLEEQRLSQPDPRCDFSVVPTFSPDGSELAMNCFMSSSGRAEIWVVPVSGGRAREVARVPGSGYLDGMTWTVDRQSLFFTSGGLGGGHLSQVAVGGGDPETLLFAHDASTLAASRDGRRLAYAQRVTNINIWRVPLADSTHTAGPPVKVVSSSRVQENPAFSPDGRRLAFDSTRSGAPEIWISDADGSNAFVVTSFGGPSTGSPQWSPDGRWVAFDSGADGGFNIYVVAAEGGPMRKVATGRTESATPSWSTDGRWLYFTSKVDGTVQIFRVRPEGGTATQVTRQGGYAPHASPDGRWIYYWNEIDSSLWSVSAAGEDERHLSGMPPLRGAFNASWTVGPSGMYFIDAEPPHPGIDFLDFASQRTQRVVDLPGPPVPSGGPLALSPDGRGLLFEEIDAVTSEIMLVENFR